MFGAAGAVAWALRGSRGFGGFDGALVPGLTWALLWVAAHRSRGVEVPGAGFWAGLGVAAGGTLGYGVYVSWIAGRFLVDAETTLAVHPLAGYAWLAACGTAWGGLAGVLGGWSAGGRASKGRWGARACVPAAFAVAAIFAVDAFPDFFHPLYSTGVYQAACSTCARAASTNATNAVALAWVVGALLVACVQRDWTTLTWGLALAAGVGAPFTAGAVWNLLYGAWPFDWWKAWELTTGFGGGSAFGALTTWSVGRGARGPDPATPLRDGRLGPRWPIHCAHALAAVTWYGVTSNLGVLLGLYGKELDQYAFPPGRLLLFLPVALAIAAHWLLDARRGAEQLEAGRRVQLGLALLTGAAFVAVWPATVAWAYLPAWAAASASRESLKRRT
ncbi:MAG: hypothetical protein Kow0069_12460 [Promethearchaeota archaeon]